jgi:hypothetical protein
VPPPPVAGAPVATGRADRRRFADGDAEGLALALGVVDRAMLLGERLAVAESLGPGENVGGVDEGEDAEQDATEAEASMAKVAPLAAANLALSLVPTLVMYPSLASPHARGRWRNRFQVPVPEGQSRGRPARSPHRPRSDPKSAVGRHRKATDGADMKWPAQH